jgi:putative addiction module killer protein
MIQVRKYTLYATKEYQKWFNAESFKAQAQIVQRLEKIEWESHFGDIKNIGDGVYELRWKNGRRVYYTLIPESNLVLLLGGYKNDQKKDICRAKKISNTYTIQNS